MKYNTITRRPKSLGERIGGKNRRRRREAKGTKTSRVAVELNQIETWLSIVVRTLLKRGSFVSVDEWEARVLGSIGYYNQTAKPFKWTYQGKALTV